MKSSLLSMLVLIGCASVAQNSSDVVRIEFSSVTRGYQEHVIITNDSIKISRVQAGEPRIEKANTLAKGDWAELLKSLQKVILSEIPDLKSPTEKRTYDGARHSTITITTKSNQVYSHLFDDEEPHQKLKPLMKALQKKR